MKTRIAGAFASRIDRPAELVATYGPSAYILCLPLEFTSVWLRQQLSRYVLVLMALALVYLLATRRATINLPRSLSVWLLAAYIAASLASWLLTRAEGSDNSIAVLLIYPLVGLLLANLVRGEADHRRAWIAFLASALGVSLLGAVLYVAHASIWAPNPLVAARLNITFGDPNITARFLSLGACTGVMMFASRRGPSWLAAAAAVACAAVLPLTLSRSGLALFVASVLLAVVVSFNHRRAAAIGLAALLVFVMSTTVNPSTRHRAEDGVATLLSLTPFAGMNRAASPSQDQGTFDDNRTYLIAAGVKMFTDHPLTGVGFGGYQHALVGDYSRFLPSSRSGANLDTLSHAALVTVLAEQGAVGTLLLVAFLLALAWEALLARRRRDEWALWSSIPAALVVPIFAYSQIEGRFFSEPYLWLALGLMYSAQQAAARVTVAEHGAARMAA